MKKETIGDRIKKYRAEMNLSQASLAKLLGWSASRIGNYESNAREVDSRTAQILATQFGVTPAALMFGHEDNVDSSYISTIKKGFVFVKGEAIMSADDAFELNENFAGKLMFYSEDPGAFALKIRGDSMFPRINAGEFVVVEPSISPNPGDEVLVMFKDGQNMIKKLEYHRDKVYRFTSINQNNLPITTEEDSIKKVLFISAIVKSVRYSEDKS